MIKAVITKVDNQPSADEDIFKNQKIVPQQRGIFYILRLK